MHIPRILLIVLLLSAHFPASPLLAADENKATLPQQAKSLSAEKLALEAIIRIEKGIAESDNPSKAIFAADTSRSKKSVQDRLTDEHQRAKDGGYDKEFHEAIKNNGGTRLKEEWKKNCRSRVMNPKDARGSADLAETNCY